MRRIRGETQPMPARQLPLALAQLLVSLLLGWSNALKELRAYGPLDETLINHRPETSRSPRPASLPRGMRQCRRHCPAALASSLFRNQSHGLQQLTTRLRATQQPYMLGPALGQGLPAAHLGMPTALRTENSHRRCMFCHSSTPSRPGLSGAPGRTAQTSGTFVFH